jgi:epoxyqueuosine reductase
MNILLHICCAPCSIYPFKELLKNPDNKVTGFYFNPNIHPEDEYTKRRSAIEAYSKNNNLEVIYPEYEPDHFFMKILNNEEAPGRCRICWQMRLEKTSLYASKNGFDSFSTTLLISPYQDHLVIRAMGEDIARRSSINFYYRDFRNNFREAQDDAREKNLYRQKYCGCKYSEEERFQEKKITAVKKYLPAV